MAEALIPNDNATAPDTSRTYFGIPDITISVLVPIILGWFIYFATHILLVSWPMTSAEDDRICNMNVEISMFDARSLVHVLAVQDACNSIKKKATGSEETSSQIDQDTLIPAQSEGINYLDIALTQDEVDGADTLSPPNQGLNTPPFGKLQIFLNEDSNPDKTRPFYAEASTSIAPAFYRGNAVFIAVLAAGLIGGAASSLRSHVYHVAKGTHRVE